MGQPLPTLPFLRRAESATPSDKPTKIGKYDVIDVIGHGGMGVVYKATDPQLSRVVAIKMIIGSYSENPELLKRFFREAQATGSLQHPNIVTIFELGNHGANPYLVMEFLEGQSLDSIINSHRPLSLFEKINIMIEVCHGLSYAHERGIVHRDVKPANIMVSPQGAIKLVDFGIAHFADHKLTGTGRIIGSLSYTSPEQANGRPVDARSDIFSTGVVLYQLCTGVLPFDGEDSAAILQKIFNDPPPPLQNFMPDYPPELESIILHALAKNREERYPSADDFARDLAYLYDQLKHEIIEQHLQQAMLELEQSEFHNAKDQLLQVLKLDRRHDRAHALLREVQHKIQTEDCSEKVRQLQVEAEQAYAEDRFESALKHLDAALRMDSENRELQEFRKLAQAAHDRVRKLRDALSLAGSAHKQGNLDAAKQAIEEALAIAPYDPQAKALYPIIQRDWEEQSRQQQLEDMFASATTEIASHRFTPAIDILKQARRLDPEAPQIQALMDSAIAGREQEKRRRDIEAVAAEIEDALKQGDYRNACGKADEALKRFPDEGALLTLQILSERQLRFAERKQFVEQQLASAQKLLEEGRTKDSVSLLDIALLAHPNEQSLSQMKLEVTSRLREEEKHLQQDSERRRVPESHSLRPSQSNAPAEALPNASAPTAEDRERGKPTAPEVKASSQLSSADISAWPQDILRIVEHQLANFVGPVARIMVKRAASSTSDPKELYELLAKKLERETDRKAFLAGRTKLGRSSVLQQPLREASQVARLATPPGVGSQSELTPAAIERTAAILTRYLGPISTILTERAARRAESLSALYLLLAEHLDNKTERARFLREVGFPDS